MLLLDEVDKNGKPYEKNSARCDIIAIHNGQVIDADQ